MASQPIRVAGSGMQFLNLPFGDTTYTKVFVGGLAWETQSETLHRYFEQFGEILEAVVITDKHTARSKGYGFVTFRDPEAAHRACADPSPVIDGRRANCNLASLGRPQLSLPYGRMRSGTPYFGSPQTTRGPYQGSPSYHQQIPYGYQPGFPYFPYGYSAYGPEYVYPQGIYNSYVGQHQPQLYSMQGTVNTNVLPYGQMGHSPTSSLGYRSAQNFVMPRHPHILQYGRPTVSGTITEAIPAIQTPYFTGTVAPSVGQARSIVPSHPEEFPKNSGSD